MNFCIRPEEAQDLVVLLFTLREHTVFCSTDPRPSLIVKRHGDMAVIAVARSKW